MARLLFGVSGGIAAYKTLETARLAIKAGHAVRVIQTESSQRFVGAASFDGITGAPVLTSEFEDDPLRGAYPGEPAPDRAPISHLALVEHADLYLIAPGQRQHDRQAGPRPRRQPGHHRGAGRSGVGGGSGAGRPGDERPDVPPPGDAGQPRAAGRPRRDRDRPRHGRARLPRRARGRPDVRARRAARRGRGAAGRGGPAPRGVGGLWFGVRCWSRPAAPASRSTASATSATAPAGAWGSRWRRARLAAAPRSRWSPPTSRCPRPRASTSCPSGRRPSSRRPATSASTTPTCC